MTTTRAWFAGSLVLALVAQIVAAFAANQPDDAFQRLRDHPAIQYGSRPARDPVADLKRRVDAGQVRLTSESRSGYLRSILDALDVPVTSQIAVFSKSDARDEPADAHRLGGADRAARSAG
jgi:hypothetical protein